MAIRKHLRLLLSGVDAWNQWRRDNPDTRPDLSAADLSAADLSGVDLSGANLYKTNLYKANLSRANLSNAYLAWANLEWANLSEADLSGVILSGLNLHGADLSGVDLSSAKLTAAILSMASLSGAYLAGAWLNGADLQKADLSGVDLSGAELGAAALWEADLSGADLSGANLSGAYLYGADLSGADLSGADLTGAQLLDATVERARLEKARVYGVSVWDLKGTPESQTDLVITQRDEPVVTADDLEVAQFMYLMLHNKKLNRVIDTITSKVVLILGRFTPERKAILDALRDALREHNLIPVLFDFSIPADRDITETVTLLARMARFIVADLTDPASIPMELQAIAPNIAVPIRSIVHEDQEPFSMFATLRRYHWVLSPYRYSNLDELLANLETELIAPAEAKRRELHPGAGD